MNPNLTKKKKTGGWEGGFFSSSFWGAGEGTRVTDFFYYESKSKIIKNKRAKRP